MTPAGASAPDKSARHPELRALVLGASGMLGHKMLQVLREFVPDTWGTLREAVGSRFVKRVELFSDPLVVYGLDAADAPAVRACLQRIQPHIVVNCVGVIKQRPDAQTAVPSIAINSLLPHLIAETLAAWNGRLIHFSTDCVFSGTRGNYREDDDPDALDLYGRSKLLGEVTGRRALTLRTSIIGRELHHHQSLLDWFLHQQGKTVRGYRKALWSGVSTLELARLVGRIITAHPELYGLYHVSSGCISKYDLLQLLREAYELDVVIIPDDTVHCDRSLDGSKLREAIGYAPPEWRTMARELAGDPTPYERWTDLRMPQRRSSDA